MLGYDKSRHILAESEELFTPAQVDDAVERMAVAIGKRLSGSYPLVLSVMGGAVVFTGQLLPRLSFPLDFDYIHVSRYGNHTEGGELVWRMPVRENVKGRHVLALDDILDEGHTMAAIRDACLANGATQFYSAVFADKLTGKDKPVQADFVGLQVPDRYVFGFGMDAYGAWRNLPGIHALKGDVR